MNVEPTWRRREVLAWAALLLLAAGLRLWALGDRPPHHDEAIHAHFARELLQRGQYRYDPTYHGPLLFFVTAPVFALLGMSDAVARVYPALAGVGLVALPLLLRRRLGARGAWWAGALLAISPSFLYYSRFARNDVPVSLFTAAALASLLLVRRRGWKALPWVGVAAALHAISKETFYVTLPLLGVATFAVMLREGFWEPAIKGLLWLQRYRAAVLAAFAWFTAITVAAYTFFFIHPDDAFFPGKAISYWYGQHTVQRVGGPWSYHLPRLALYEALPIAAALAWAVRRGARMRRIELFCLVWGVAAIAMYAYLGEKVPWLAVHQVLPFVPLAALQLGRTFGPRGRWWSRALAAVGIALTAWSALASSFLHPALTTADPRAELIVFVQTTPEEQRLAAAGVRLGRMLDEDPVAAVSGEGSWPLSWQWRDLKVWWGLPAEGTRPPLVVCDPAEEDAVAATLGDGYERRPVPLRAWWVESWDGVGPIELARWLVTRRAWSPLGATEVRVFVREDVAAWVGGE